jgi:hypothetical protein
MWRDGFYVLCSHITGWHPNPAILVTTKGALKGPKWTAIGNPSGKSKTNHNSQSTFVLPYRHPNGKMLWIYIGDRWNQAGPGSVGNASCVWDQIKRDMTIGGVPEFRGTRRF